VKTDLVERIEIQHAGQTPATFSHNLPDRGEQQYYELIGKYFQFADWWEDYDPAVHAPVLGDVLSPMRAFYEDQRGEHNQALKRASLLATVSLLNRVVSLVDALWITRPARNRVSVSARYTETAHQPLPEIALSIRF